jgi:hypothetical protein
VNVSRTEREASLRSRSKVSPKVEKGQRLSPHFFGEIAPVFLETFVGLGTAIGHGGGQSDQWCQCFPSSLTRFFPNMTVSVMAEGEKH